MTKLSNKQYNKLVKLVEFADNEQLSVGDLQNLICDAGLCPVEHCAFYIIGEVVCPHLTEVCYRLKSNNKTVVDE